LFSPSQTNTPPEFSRGNKEGFWRVLICEPEEKQRKILENIISTHPCFNVVYKFQEYSEAVAKTPSIYPHLVFFSPGNQAENNLNFLKQIQKLNKDIRIVLCLISRKNLPEAPGNSSFFHLFKPFESLQTFQILEQANRELRALFPSRFLEAKTQKEKIYLPVEDIILIQKENRKTGIQSKNEYALCNLSLRKLLHILPSHFEQINQWQIVNLQKIWKIKKESTMKNFLIYLHHNKNPLQLTPTYRKVFMGKINLLKV